MSGDMNRKDFLARTAVGAAAAAALPAFLATEGAFGQGRHTSRVYDFVSFSQA